ncbi:MAG TPA: hypothetical protein VNC22_12365 [Sporichthya sp.]|nr:hypothetical protein [Sporichthya sp.]
MSAISLETPDGAIEALHLVGAPGRSRRDDPDATEDAWRRVFAFFSEHLSPA